MADVVQTPADVHWVSGPKPVTKIAGATLTAGMPVYRNTSTNEYEPADADTDAASEVEGVAATDGADGREFLMFLPGTVIDWGATLTAGTLYTLSTTAGAIAPDTDLGTGDYPVLMAIGAGSTDAEIIAKKGDAVHA